MTTARSKDERWLAWATHGAALFSTCTRRQYLALVVGPNGRLVGSGYNGAPPGLPHCVDGGCPRGSATYGEVPAGSTYSNCTAVHAEANAIAWSDRTAREGGTLYVNGPPCWDCGKLIAGSGLARVVHTADPAYADYDRVKALLIAAGLTVTSYPA